jgi:thiamine-phosphate pyrophosphorylase
MKPATLPRLMLVTNRHLAKTALVDVVSEAVAAGVGIVQIREKDLGEAGLSRLVRDIKDSIQDRAQIVVNGSLKVAVENNVGLHAPESMQLPDDVRDRLEPGTLLGRSVHANSRVPNESILDYVIAGHVFDTASKDGLEPLGLDGLRRIATGVSVPTFAIGGIHPGQMREVLAAGAHGTAVMSGIIGNKNPGEAASTYRKALDDVMKDSKLSDELLEIVVNGKPAAVQPGTTLSAFLAEKDLHERLVVIERNGVILRHPQYPQTIIEDGDLLEIVHFVGGG